MPLAGELQSPADPNGPANDMEAWMNAQTLTNRVEILERKVEGLAELPDRVGALELQVSQLRTEMAIEFSAVRAEMRELNEDTRREMHELNDGLRQEMRQLNEDTRREMHELNEDTRRELSGRIEDIGTHMRVLHEEVISRIALLDEHTNGPSRIRHPPTGQPRTKRKRK